MQPGRAHTLTALARSGRTVEARAELLAVLVRHAGRVADVAAELGVSYRTALRLIARLRLDEDAAELRRRAGVPGPTESQHAATERARRAAQR